MRRITGIAAGIATHLLFALTVWHLFWFLKGNSDHESQRWLWTDAVLALQFALPHSFLLRPATRRRVSSIVGSAFYGLFFCVATCLSLLLMFVLWRSSSVHVWSLKGTNGTLVSVAFIVSWIGLLYALSLTGLGYQTGWTPWWHWLRGRDLPRREFAPRGAYRWLRHPVYLSFLGLIWLNPSMSLDRLLLAGIWTAYIFVGSYWKDERMAFYVGPAYRVYQTQVTGFPLVFFGPLAKRRRGRDVELTEQLPSRPAAPPSRVAA